MEFLVADVPTRAPLMSFVKDNYGLCGQAGARMKSWLCGALWVDSAFSTPGTSSTLLLTSYAAGQWATLVLQTKWALPSLAQHYPSSSVSVTFDLSAPDLWCAFTDAPPCQHETHFQNLSSTHKP